jgi:hydrogenase maturation protease
MNKKPLAILSLGNILQKDEGMPLYTSKYIESNYSFNPSIDIIHGSIEGLSLINIMMQYKEIIVLDVIGVADTPGSIYSFPMPEFRKLGSNESSEDMGVLESLNMLERRGEILPEVTLLAIVPDSLDKGIGLSPILHHSVEAYALNIVKTIEGKGFTYVEHGEKVALETVVESFANRDLT